MIYGILNLKTGRLRFVRAGHEPLLVLDGSGGKVRQVAPEGIALGLVGSDVFDCNQEAEIQLHVGETALLYTDGVIEAMDQASEEYGRDRLIERLRQHNRQSAEHLIENVVRDIHEFTLGIPQHDDITMLALRVRETDAADRPAAHGGRQQTAATHQSA